MCSTARLTVATAPACIADVSNPHPTADLASAIEWVEGLRSSAAAAASACTQQSACVQQASSQGQCELSAAASPALYPNNSTCSSEQVDMYLPPASFFPVSLRLILFFRYRSIVDSMHVRFSRHSFILDPLLLSLKHLNTLSSPPPPLLPHALSQASQALRLSIAQYHSLLLALAARPGPVSVFSLSPVDDPVLRALGQQGALTELLAAHKVAGDVAAAGAVV
jgi:hypothetical protein